MKQHKWAKEIHAWADGAEIQVRWATKTKINENEWFTIDVPTWSESENYEYRIKPQPKEQQYLYAFWNQITRQVDFCTIYDGDNEACKYIGKIKLEDTE